MQTSLNVRLHVLKASGSKIVVRPNKKQPPFWRVAPTFMVLNVQAIGVCVFPKLIIAMVSLALGMLGYFVVERIIRAEQLTKQEEWETGHEFFIRHCQCVRLKRIQCLFSQVWRNKRPAPNSLFAIFNVYDWKSPLFVQPYCGNKDICRLLGQDDNWLPKELFCVYRDNYYVSSL